MSDDDAPENEQDKAPAEQPRGRAAAQRDGIDAAHVVEAAKSI